MSLLEKKLEAQKPKWRDGVQAFERASTSHSPNHQNIKS
jgi:hypothetical protein